MINNSEFAERLTTIMGFYQLSASAFADKIQVPRSSISHLLSGRNKPSLDFVMKVVKEFDQVELYWLLNGKGVFPRANQTSAPSNETDLNNISRSENVLVDQIQTKSNQEKKAIERIVIFFKDGTFKEYTK